MHGKDLIQQTCCQGDKLEAEMDFPLELLVIEVLDPHTLHDSRPYKHYRLYRLMF